MSVSDKNKDKKDIIVEYYAEVPVYKYAAMAAGISEDSLRLWREADSAFSARLDLARATWVRKRVPKAKIEFALERLESEIFGPKQKVELETGKSLTSILLEKYGVIEGGDNDRKDDGAVSAAPTSKT